MRAREVAEQLSSRHGLSVPVDLKRLAADLGVQVVFFPFEGRIKEVIVASTIGVLPGLSRPWFRWYVAHALGHHLMHVGTSFYLESWQWVNHAKAERQAEEFAAALVAGRDGARLGASELGIPPSKVLLVRRLSGPH